ncbi:MAG: hypothetical protein RMJ67_09965, partial [Elusimicrobiota bacterium]|nr:hypothetical protein [Endomicrobiia bacterium]MDW8166820.1 hypothetical protein [Elusimicrobiota bacterium]
ENKQFNEEIEKLKKEYRNILLPRFDEYIKKFSEISNVVKFDDKNINFKKLFVDFLKDIIQSKVVIFGEITKTQKLEIDNEKRQKLIEKFNEKEEKLQNIDLAILAEEISQRENIPYRDALIKAKKILNEGGV